MAINEIPSTQIGLRIRQAMDERGWSMKDLAAELDQSYEFVRRLVRGSALPSTVNLKIICQEFGWDYAAMRTLLVQDRFRVKNGPDGTIAQTVNPEVQPFELSWHMLDKQQKEILLAQLNLFILQNRRSIRSGNTIPFESFTNNKPAADSVPKPKEEKEPKTDDPDEGEVGVKKAK